MSRLCILLSLNIIAEIEPALLTNGQLNEAARRLGRFRTSQEGYKPSNEPRRLSKPFRLNCSPCALLRGGDMGRHSCHVKDTENP